MDDRDLDYHRIHRAGRRGAWRPLVGIAVVVVGSLLLAPLVWQLVFVAGFAVTGQPVRETAERTFDFTDPTPLTLAYLNLSLASAIPVTWLVTRVLHGLRPRWLTSVLPRMRWRFFVACLGLSFVALVATLLVTGLLPQPDTGSELTGGVNDFTSTTRDFLLVVVLLTPLQAAGEEYLFRGYLTQAIGGLVASRVVAVLAPALLFGLAHGVQDPPIFFDRFAFGVVAGVLVLATGGLEAAIAMHVLNNFLAFGLALAFADLGAALNPTGGSWWSLPGTLTQSLVYLALAWWVARRMGLERRVEGAVLAGPDSPVYRSHSVP